MPRTIKRHFLKERETEEILRRFSRRFSVDAKRLLGSEPRMEVAETESEQIFIVNGKPVLARFEGVLMPTLLFEEIFQCLPVVIVDMGAVPHICNGADVMAPGIVDIEGSFKEGEILAIVDEQHKKPLAMGRAFCDSETMRKLTYGKVISNLHYVGDKLWTLLKEIE